MIVRPLRSTMPPSGNGARFIPTLIAATLAGLSACSPVYTFQSTTDARVDPRALQPQARVAALLTARGFRSIGSSDRATGDIGCGRSAIDRETFEKEWNDSGLFTTHQWVWVHTFSCEERWQIAVVSTRDADAEAAEVRDALSAEFSREIATGDLQVDRKYRLALE